jgi:hypothetical protein
MARPSPVPQLEPFLVRPHGERLGRGVDDLGKVERIGVELEPACFHVGEVEHVVDDVEQRVGGVLGHRQVFALLERQLRAERKAGHPDDAVERRADLVAHVGEELALGFVGGLRDLFGPLQLHLSTLSVRHIVEEDGRSVLEREHARLEDAVVAFAPRDAQVLQDRCRSDPHRLLDRRQQLLWESAPADRLLERQALHGTQEMSSRPGTCLGPYEIVRAIGAGGIKDRR